MAGRHRGGGAPGRGIGHARRCRTRHASPSRSRGRTAGQLGDARDSWGTITMTGQTRLGHAPGLERLLLEFDKIAAFSDLYFSNSTVDERGVSTFDAAGRPRARDPDWTLRRGSAGGDAMNRSALLLTALAAVALVVLSFLFLIKPKMDEVAALEVEAAGPAVAAGPGDLADRGVGGGACRQSRTSRPSWPRSARSCPHTPALPSALRQLQVAADDSGVTLVSVAPGRPSLGRSRGGPAAGHDPAQPVRRWWVLPDRGLPAPDRGSRPDIARHPRRPASPPLRRSTRR